MAEPIKIRKSRASSSEEARRYRQTGYDDALEFATLIGVASDYKNDFQAKKDVVDPSGDAHSVKGGKLKWQIFLYSQKRFADEIFGSMNGVGQLLSDCIDAFPSSFEEYRQNEIVHKEKLQISMRKLAEKLTDQRLLRGFLYKSLFDGGEVKYLTFKHDNTFHVFLNRDIIQTLIENLQVDNSKARNSRQMDAQKVVFKYKGYNLGELEMRNDTTTHYKEIRFNMIKPKAMDLFFTTIPLVKKYNERVFVYGNASKVFGRWPNVQPSE